jgi:hypothetical protein
MSLRVMTTLSFPSLHWLCAVPAPVPALLSQGLLYAGPRLETTETA